MRKFIEFIKGIETATVVRTLALGVAFVNQLLAAFGISPLPFDAEAVELVLSTVITGIISVWAWWKDNDITKSARERKRKQNRKAKGVK